MHLPVSPPAAQGSGVHLAALWGRVARTHAIPDDVDVDKLYLAIRHRLRDAEWEVRLHALRALADLLPVSNNALAFPFNEVLDNLGHGSPTVRKAALDALKVFCLHCEEPACVVRELVNRCDHPDDRTNSGVLSVNMMTGLILSIPSVVSSLRKRCDYLDFYPLVLSLGLKLFDATHRDIALRSLIKLRRVCGTEDFLASFDNLSPEIKDKFRVLCDIYDEDSFDVYYPPRQVTSDRVYFDTIHSNGSGDSSGSSTNLANMNIKSFSTKASPNSSQGEGRGSEINGKVIVETQIAFDSDTAITMTVLEENTSEESEHYTSDESGSTDRRALRVGGEGSESDTEDQDAVITAQKRVRFGGEMIKIRTPDSENLTASEDENKSSKLIIPSFSTIPENPIENTVIPKPKKPRKSGIPLPLIPTGELPKRLNSENLTNKSMTKRKSKSLNELYEYFRTKNNIDPVKPVDVKITSDTRIEYKTRNKHVSRIEKARDVSPSSFALSVVESMYPEPVLSPVEPHREVEVLHNLQRSPTRSPGRTKRVTLDQDGFVLTMMRSSPEQHSPDVLTLDSSGTGKLLDHYEWEKTEAIPKHIIEQLHNTDNWISAVRAADQLHRALLAPATAAALEPHGRSLADHMWALGARVSAARAPTESAVCALVRLASPGATRRMLPALVRRLAAWPAPAALPHALLARMSLAQLLRLLFDDDMIGMSGEPAEAARLQGAWCVARAAGPAAVLAAVRHMATTPPLQHFYIQLQKKLGRSDDGYKSTRRASMLPVPIRRRSRSTPPSHPLPPPRRLRPISDSAPLPGSEYPIRDGAVQPLFPILSKEYKEESSTGTSERTNQSTRSSADVSREEISDIVEELVLAETRPHTPKSPSVHVEDVSSIPDETDADPKERNEEAKVEVDDVSSSRVTSGGAAGLAVPGSSPATPAPPSRGSASLPASTAPSRSPSPVSAGHPLSAHSRSQVDDADRTPRDVRALLATHISPPRQQEDWEAIVRGLREVERLAADPACAAPAAAWRTVARATAGHVRSLRSRVARTACSTLGTLFAVRGKILETETEEAAGALLDRSADVNRFLRGDAEDALVRLACGVAAGRAVVALARRGASHRAAPVRAAAASALTALVVRRGAPRALDLPAEPRSLLLRAAVELLGDASPEARAHARRLCVALAADPRFRPLLQETLPPAKFRAVEKSVDSLRGR